MLVPAASRGSDRSLPMHFELRREGPASACGIKCRLFVAASGAITADTPRDFQDFAQDRELAGATVVLDSDGGSVHGAIALGREIRRLGLDTTVGRLTDVDDAQPQGAPRAKLAPRANCESMCAFVLIAGVHRFVPPEARVMVHQIWLGDRREDPTAATYSAEDLVLVQRDIGRLVRYTSEMGGSMELVDLALRIPPWEPMHMMTRAEIRAAQVETAAPDAAAATVASSPPALPAQRELPQVTDGARATAISEQRWATVEQAGGIVLARSHPLTLGGEAIGSFDLMVACAAGDSYEVNYVERRRSGGHTPLPDALGQVSMTSVAGIAKFKVVSSQRRNDADELVTYAAAMVPARLIDAFAAAGDHSMMITTESGAGETAIRIGNTGAEQSLPQLSAACQKLKGHSASLDEHRAGGLASAK